MNLLIGKGKMVFDPINRTKKHNKQNWKRTAMIVCDDDTTAYYRWLIENRYPLIQGVKGVTTWLNPPLRGTHVTVINDMVGRDLTEEDYRRAKEKYDSTEVYFFYNWDGLRNNGEHIFFKVECPMAMEIRKEAGLGDPYFGLHMTVGLVANEGVKKKHLKNVADYMKCYPGHFKNK